MIAIAWGEFVAIAGSVAVIYSNYSVVVAPGVGGYWN
jgi:hypothetical protein